MLWLFWLSLVSWLDRSLVFMFTVLAKSPMFGSLSPNGDSTGLRALSGRQTSQRAEAGLEHTHRGTGPLGHEPVSLSSPAVLLTGAKNTACEKS